MHLLSGAGAHVVPRHYSRVVPARPRPDVGAVIHILQHHRKHTGSAVRRSEALWCWQWARESSASHVGWTGTSKTLGSSVLRSGGPAAGKPHMGFLLHKRGPQSAAARQACPARCRHRAVRYQGGISLLLWQAHPALARGIVQIIQVIQKHAPLYSSGWAARKLLRGALTW